MGSRRVVPLLCVLVLAIGGWAVAGNAADAAPEWAINVNTIEACSCPMFCQCYFNAKPAVPGEVAANGHGHAGHGSHGEAEGAGAHYCKFNNAYQVNRGHFGATSLDGARFWIAGDLGDDFSHGKMNWATVYFDRKLTPEQRSGLGTIIGHMFPVEWKSLTIAEADIDTWTFDKDSAVATMDGGKTAEVRLRRFQGMTDAPVVVHNLRYWGVPRNDGFVMMPNEIEAYRVGPNAYEFKGTNGFMINLDMTSKDVPPAAVATSGR
jgi:hypothetical protein